MAPTLQVNDRFLVNKLCYRLHPIQHEDIIIFAAPDKVMAGHPDFPKRVAGLPGDVVSVARGRVLVGGQEFDHEFIREATFRPTAGSAGYVDAGEHHVKFVPNGVLANGQFVPKARLALLLTGDSHVRVTIMPGCTIRNGRLVAEPFAAEDPDYDLCFFQGHALTHRRVTYGLRDYFEQDQRRITKAEYERESALPEERIPPGQIVVFGDNRNDSRESSVWGLLPETTVEGKATLLFSPQWRRLR